MAKKPTKTARKPNFPLVFWGGLRERAETIAADDHGGNLSALVNTAVKAYVTAKERAKSK